jgi:phosphoribosyl 1,2-cyclic phosphodiesterase
LLWFKIKISFPSSKKRFFFVFLMSLFITSLNSGSNGNCYYVGNSEEAVLIDAGISCLETEKRMLRLGLSMNTVKAIFISHEHTDHISGLATVAKKYQLPVYITTGTHFYSGIQLEASLIKPLLPYEPVAIGDLTVTAFPKLHDAAEPHSFVVHNSKVKVGVFTDIGKPCEHVIRNFKECHAAFLEANYDEVMLEQGSYPRHLKNRIRGGKGHLSNAQALLLFRMHRAPYMSHLLLAHLSKNNNHPQLVEDLFKQYAGNTTITVASRYKETPVYCIRDTASVIIKPVIRIVKPKPEQLSLF